MPELSRQAAAADGVAVLYAEPHLLVLDKPAGLLCVPGRGADKQDCLAARAQRLYPDALTVHRLDMATSGLCLMARGAPMQRLLGDAFAQRRVGKRYVAIVHGRPAAEPAPHGWGLIDLPISPDWPNRPLRIIDLERGKPSQTRWRMLGPGGAADATRLELEPLTGRSHQLRLHLRTIGHPILGDPWYAPPEIHHRSARLLLHASGLRLAHPRDGAGTDVREPGSVLRRMEPSSHSRAPTPMPENTVAPALIQRRAAVALIALPAIWTGLRAQPAPARRPTPAQTEGPFYPVELPKDADFDLLRNGSLDYTQGRPAWVEGTVTDLQGKPVAGAQVEIWQCDEAGHYHHPQDRGKADPAFQGFGRVTAGADGRYRFHTIRPAPYTGRAPHIHVKVRLGRRELLTTQLYVAGEPRNERDFLWRQLGEEGRRAVTVPFLPSPDGLRADFPIVLAG